ncbi:MAG: elongation factor G [SAR202 cluster bacterium]|nr:elongation factor G [SAR202 cluster bacterium]
MTQFTTKQIRNVTLVSHSAAGKTSLVESMLFTAKAMPRIGRVEDHTTVSDYEPEEHKRLTSLQLSVVPVTWKEHKINVLDTPAYADFSGETASALRVADAAVLVVAAPAGVEVGTEMVWKQLQALKMPTLVFVTKMDKDHADFMRSLEQARAKLGQHCAAVTLPVGAEKAFSGVISVLGDQARDGAGQARERLAEMVAETDDALTEKFLGTGDLTDDEIANGLRVGVRACGAVPVLAGSAVTGAGIPELLDAIVSLLPSPADVAPTRAAKNGEPVTLPADPKGPLAALVFKTSADPFVGRLSYFRVYSGTLRGNSEVFNSTHHSSERIAQVTAPMGKAQHTVGEVAAGDIGTLAKLTHVLTGDTLTTKAEPIVLPGIEFPTPIYSVAVHPKSKADMDKLSTALARLTEEDPTLRISRDQATGELIVTGLGDTHVEVMAERAKRKFGVDLELAPPKVPYRETITKPATIEHKHKKQSGGHGQYGHVVLRLEPARRGAGFKFVNQVVGGAVPKEYVPAVEKGIQKAMEEGAFAGFHVTDIKVALTDGSSHPVDSSGQSFELAGAAALKHGVQLAQPALLEPVMRVRIALPDEAMGAVVGDLNTRRAHIVGMTPGNGMGTIEATLPQVEAQQYSTKLRALTQGRGRMTIEFDHYGEVPANLTQKIVEARQKDAVKV